MPEWYVVLMDARYARMPAPDFARLPLYWQEMYRTARVAEFEATETVPDVEAVG